VPLADQKSGRSLQPYAWNVSVVGHNPILNRGLNGNLGWVDDCAYVPPYFGGNHHLVGLAVLNVSDPRNPRLVEIFPGSPGTREAQVEGSQTSRMVVVMPFSEHTVFGDPAGRTQLQIYRVPPNDCGHPIRVGTYNFGLMVTHEFRIWRDKIYVTNNSTSPWPSLSVIDVKDMAHPRLLTTWDLSDEPEMAKSYIHDLDILGADDALAGNGSRAYVNIHIIRPFAPMLHGLAILDTTEVAQGKPHPVIHRMGLLTYAAAADWGASHSAAIVRISGRRYVLAQDETFTTAHCPWAGARIIDVENESTPVQVSTFRLQVSEQRNCGQTLSDHAMYSAHYLGVDDPNNAKLAFFTWYSSGLRVVDISNPAAPREVGYFIPGATPNTIFSDTHLDRFFNRNVDYSYSYVRFYQGNIWFTSIYGGFWVVHFASP
jgi:hypothetical protein